MKKLVLAALRKKRGYTHAELAEECRKRPGGELIGDTNLCSYLNGSRPIGDTHFQILCEVLRVRPEEVQTSRYLVGGPRDSAEMSESVAEEE